MDWETMCKMTLSCEFEAVPQSGNSRKTAQSGLCTAVPRRQNEFLEVPSIFRRKKASGDTVEEQESQKSSKKVVFILDKAGSE